MRKLIIIVFLLLPVSLLAQTKVGYIDSKVIMDQLIDAKDAQQNLNNIVNEWRGELQIMEDSLALVSEDFEKKKLILTDKVKEQREAELRDFNRRINEYKTAKFGENGEYFQKQIEYMKPVQDKIFKAIQDVAREGEFDYVFDRSSEILLLYVNEKYDLTQRVINKLETQ
jgi:outer membrane protein